MALPLAATHGNIQAAWYSTLAMCILGKNARWQVLEEKNSFHVVNVSCVETLATLFASCVGGKSMWDKRGHALENSPVWSLLRICIRNGRSPAEERKIDTC